MFRDVESLASIFDNFRSWKANSELVSPLVRTALFIYALRFSICSAGSAWFISIRGRNHKECAETMRAMST